MTKGVILSNTDAPLYRVRIEFNTEFADAEIESLNNLLIEIEQKVLDARFDVEVLILRPLLRFLLTLLIQCRLCKNLPK